MASTAGYHKVDPLALVAGVLSVLGAGLFLLDDLTPVSLKPGVIVAMLVITLGAAGLLTARRRLSRTDHPPV